MKLKIKNGWRIAFGGFFFAFIIQSMLVMESYQFEESVFRSKIEAVINSAVNKLNTRAYKLGKDNSPNIAGVDQDKNIVHIIMNGVSTKFGVSGDYDRALVNRQAQYDLCDTGIWRVENLNEIFQNELVEVKLDTPIEFILKDTTGQVIDYFSSGKINFWSKVEAEPIKLGFISPRILEVNYQFGLDYYLTVAAERLYMAGLFFIILVFCFYLLLRTIKDEKKSAEYQRKLVHSLVHNLKNPIAACIAVLNRLKKSCPQQEEFAANEALLLQMNKLLENAKHNVEDLLSKQADQNGIRLSKQRVNIDKLLNELITFYKAMSQDEKEVVFHLDNRLPKDFFLYADASHLYSVLGNLIDNAIKYSGKSVDITLSVNEENEKVFISVKDNGWGISEDKQSRVFDSGYRGNSTLSGSGIGLHYTRMVAEAHRGKISVKSTVGEGSEFTMELPQRNKFHNLKRWLCRKK